jgi:hypothetical protein
MKLAALYTVFNGLELLEKSIKQIEPYVNDIVICYQKTSNTGNISNDVEQFCKRFAEGKFHVIEFIPDLKMNTKQNERNKHQQMIDFAKELKCTHFIISACDHFYTGNDFLNGKYICNINDYDVTFTKMYTYYKNPTWQINPIEDYYCPFICKLYPHTRVERMPNYPVHTDPSLQYSTCNKHYTFPLSMVALHHYSMVRVNIKDKFLNAAASMRWKDSDVQRFILEYSTANPKDNLPLSYFGGRKLIEVPNYFDL